jgi:integrase
MSYRRALEARYGSQPPHALIFQVLDVDGPAWAKPKGASRRVPLAWTKNAYNQWVRRIWMPARVLASQAPDAPPGLAAMTFYDCRHTAISMALHSTLVMGPLGMNLHSLAALAGHDIATLEHYYRHVIARYVGKPPIDLQQECAKARARVEESPFRGVQLRSAHAEDSAEISAKGHLGSGQRWGQI